MADTKPVETAPVVEPVAETKPQEETVAAAEPTAAAEPEVAPAATETVEEPAAAATEEAKKDEEVEKKPIEEGTLSHKGEGANFPKNLIFNKKLFWFGSDPVDLKATSSFKADKVAEVAHHVTAWAAQTGNGLLFFSEKDKSAPQGAIQLAEASEPATDGSHKFHFTSKGHKHSFKAASTAERDAWVEQLKIKIAEAKELVATVTESETYTKTLESLKPASKKEDKKAEATAEADKEAEPAAAVEETPAVATDVAAEAPKEEEETKKEEAEKEEPKRRSASRKRASIFGSFLGKKEDKKVEAPTEAKVDEAEAPAEPAAVDATEAPAAEPAVDAAAPATTEAAATEPKVEDKKEDAHEAKPTPAKRASLFGSLSFGKKKVVSPEPTPAAEEPSVATEAVAETAPVIPAVETTEPLSAEVSSPATVPTETVDATPAISNEAKKEMKSDKRKSSIPFVSAFGKREKATSDEEGEKPKSPSAFSKLRATIKGKKSEKTEKAEEKPEGPIAEDAAAEAPAESTEAEAAATTEEPAKSVTATPAVTAAA